jgi:hypothetical protein
VKLLDAPLRKPAKRLKIFSVYGECRGGAPGLGRDTAREAEMTEAKQSRRHAFQLSSSRFRGRIVCYRRASARLDLNAP